MKLYGVIGAGGFGREVMPIAREFINASTEKRNNEFVFVVENLEKPTSINGHKVISKHDFISYKADEKYFNIAIANYEARERIANQLVAKDIKPFSIQSNSTAIYDNNDIGDGAILCAFTTITSNAKIGRFFHANIYSYVAHDCVVGDFVTFAPSVHCNGRVIVEDYAYVGTGVVIKEGMDDRPIVIGRGAVVGMGAVVTKSVAPFTTVIGNHARELKMK